MISVSPPDHRVRPPIKLAVIGCGAIAQVAHLPSVTSVAGIEVVALCDTDLTRAAAVAAQHGIAEVSGRWEDVVTDEGVDAVAVLTSAHRDIALGAARAAKHVFVEKPLAFSPAGAREIERAATVHGSVVLVGYMKLHDSGWSAVREEIGDLSDRDLVRVHNSSGGTTDWRDRLVPAGRCGQVPEAPGSFFGEEWQEVRALPGGHDESNRGLLRTLLMLGIHDLSLLGELFSRLDVEATCAFAGKGLLATLRGDGAVPISLELDGNRQWGRFRESMSFFGRARSVRINFSHPYVRESATVVEVERATPPRGAEGSVQRTTYRTDCYRREWEHFRDCITGDATPTPGAGAARAASDVELATRLFCHSAKNDSTGSV